MSSRARINRAWLSQHAGKVTFRSRAHAWLVIAAIAVRERRADLYLHPYECRWHNAAAGREPEGGAPPHIHIGHSRHAPWPRLRRRLRHLFVYPVLRARRELRIRLGLAIRPPARKNRQEREKAQTCRREMRSARGKRSRPARSAGRGTAHARR